jgi:hypothetical protein
MLWLRSAQLVLKRDKLTRLLGCWFLIARLQPTSYERFGWNLCDGAWPRRYRRFFGREKAAGCSSRSAQRPA